jgi:hypothetical protein
VAKPFVLRYLARVAPRRRSPRAALVRAAFLVAALPALVRAAARVVLWERRLPLDELVARLRAVPPFLLLWQRRRPEWLLACLDRLLPVLPPRRYGLCLRRSLLLLDLWSRCGLSVRLHLGVRRPDEGPHEGHAWVTAASAAGGRAATSSQGYPEAFEL